MQLYLFVSFWLLRNIYFSNDRSFFLLSRFFSLYHWLDFYLTWPWKTRWASDKKQELLLIREHMGSSQGFSVFRVLVFSVVFVCLRFASCAQCCPFCVLCPVLPVLCLVPSVARFVSCAQCPFCVLCAVLPVLCLVPSVARFVSYAQCYPFCVLCPVLPVLCLVPSIVRFSELYIIDNYFCFL